MNWASMVRVFRTTLALLILSLLAFAPSARAAYPSDVALLLTSMNAVRLSSHLRPLRLDRRLCKIAYDHAVDMQRRHYFAHVTPDGLTPYARMARAHYRFGYAGENQALDRSARVIFQDFWNSREHRANMLGKHYAHVGIASIAESVGTVVVEDFSD
jgi:uncharacterized protein YkwD